MDSSWVICAGGRVEADLGLTSFVSGLRGDTGREGRLSPDTHRDFAERNLCCVLTGHAADRKLSGWVARPFLISVHLSS